MELRVASWHVLKDDTNYEVTARREGERGTFLYWAYTKCWTLCLARNLTHYLIQVMKRKVRGKRCAQGPRTDKVANKQQTWEYIPGFLAFRSHALYLILIFIVQICYFCMEILTVFLRGFRIALWWKCRKRNRIVSSMKAGMFSGLFIAIFPSP